MYRYVSGLWSVNLIIIYLDRNPYVYGLSAFFFNFLSPFSCYKRWFVFLYTLCVFENVKIFRLRNCAFVDFTNEALALQALRQLNGYIISPYLLKMNINMLFLIFRILISLCLLVSLFPFCNVWLGLMNLVVLVG